jgi:hypothetical protein
MKKVRDNITFHYLHDKVETALASLSKKFPDDNRPISIGKRSIELYLAQGRGDKLLCNLGWI